MRAKVIVVSCVVAVISFCMLATSSFVRDLLLIYGATGYIVLAALAVFLICFIAGQGIIVAKMAPTKPVPEKDVTVHSLSGCITRCSEYLHQHRVSPFEKRVVEMMEQSKRMLKKTANVESILESKFGEGGLTHSSYFSTVKRMETLFIRGIEEAILQLEMFDEQDYINNGSNRLKGEKDTIYKSVLAFIESVANNGELILVKYDQLALQLAQLGTVSDDQFSRLLEEVGVDDLITNTKQYDRSDFSV